MGYSNLFDILPFLGQSEETLEQLTRTSITNLLAWRKEEEKEEVQLKTWKCKWCGKEQTEDVKGYSKYDFVYCSMACLGAHTKVNSN